MFRQFLAIPPLFLASAWGNRFLIVEMTKREVLGRYRGSVMGILWSLLNPILMLSVYTVVFSMVFKSRWGEGQVENRFQFALVLFAGLLVYNLFSECVGRAPKLILENASYVKKVVFPLEILPVVVLGSGLFHALVSFAVLLAATVAMSGGLPWTVLLVPVLLFPLVPLILGISWLLASLGVFLRDIGQVITMLLMALLFLSPIFFPATALPPSVRPWLFLNPLALVIEEFRNALFFRGLPDFLPWLLLMGFSSLCGWLGLFWFQKTRKGFADVL